MADEFKMRVTVEAAEALANIQNVSEATQEMGKVVDEAAKDSVQNSQAMGSAFKGVESSLLQMTQAFIGFAAIKSAIVDTFQQITEEAMKAHAEVAKLSRATGGLSANIGGKLAGEAVSIVGGISGEAGLSPEEHMQALEFMASMSDMRNVDPRQIKPLAEAGVLLQKSTGNAFAGAAGAEAMQMAVSRLGIDDMQAVNLLSSLGNTGFDAGTVTNLISRGADMDMLAMMASARGSGLPMNQVARKMDSVLGSLTRTNEQGQLDEGLVAMGITDAMSPTQRLKHLAGAFQDGTINQGQFFAATGGQANQSLIQAILPSLIDESRVDAAKGSLMADDAAVSAVARRMESPYAQAEFLENRKRLKKHAEEIQMGQQEYAKAAVEFDDGGTSFLGIPTFMRTVYSLTANEARSKAASQQMTEDIAGRFGSADAQDRMLMRSSSSFGSSDPMAIIGGIFKGAAEPIQQIIININNSVISQDGIPMKDLSPAWRQD